MRVLDPGHKYGLSVLDGTREEVLTFVKREGANYPGNVGTYSGTTIQEVLRALIDRVKYVAAQQACTENGMTLDALRTALWSLERRAARVHGLELSLTIYDINDIELVTVCPRCGHITCPH